VSLTEVVCRPSIRFLFALLDDLEHFSSERCSNGFQNSFGFEGLDDLSSQLGVLVEVRHDDGSELEEGRMMCDPWFKFVFAFLKEIIGQEN
jgi:hypothetical protein